MNTIEMGKDLIKKGQILGDEELILMGTQMLENHKSEIKVDFTKDETPNVDIELEPPIEKKAPQKFEYLCENCGCECSFDKERKRCPECRKQKLILSDVNAKREENLPEGIDRIFNGETPKLKTDEDGNILGKYAQPQPLDMSKMKHNRFQDDTSLLSDDPEDKYLRTKPIGPRTRPKYQTKDVICTKCGKKESINPFLVRSDYVCNRCLSRRRV